MVKISIILAVFSAATVVSAEYFGHTDSHNEDHSELFNHDSGALEHSFDSFDHNEHLGGQEDLHSFSEHGEEEKHEEPKNYNFDYAVHDPHTHGYHSHQESSHDGVVKGHYSVKEADGSLREVYYTADKKNGFKAIVTKNGVQVHPHTDGSSHSTGSLENLVHH